LREDRTMPEPLSFADWQDNLLQLVKGAKDGDFNETWHRLDGKARRVMGRPQPEGSFAFLVEDVTNEIKLNKSVSDQLDLYQSAMDGLDAAIGVFDAAKTLIISNTMFNDLFDIPETDEIYILKLDQWLKTLQPTVSQEFLHSLSTASLSETVIQSKAPDQTFKLNARSLKNGQLIITLTPRTPVFRTTLSRYEKGLMTHE
jgi:PAS domain-containing protein